MPSLGRQAEDVEAGEENVAWRLHNNLPISERDPQGSQRQTV